MNYKIAFYCLLLFVCLGAAVPTQTAIQRRCGTPVSSIVNGKQIALLPIWYEFAAGRGVDSKYQGFHWEDSAGRRVNQDPLPEEEEEEE